VHGPDAEEGVLSTVRLDRSGLEELAAGMCGLLAPGFVLLLEGGLGAGKSTFARALLRAAGVEGAIPSPSFVVDAVYEVGGLTVHHIDLFRLDGDPYTLAEYGVLDALDSGDAALVEWAEKLPPGAAARGVRVTLAFTDDPDCREVGVEPFGDPGR